MLQKGLTTTNSITLRLGGLPRFFFSVFIVVSPLFLFRCKPIFLWPLCGHFGAWGVPNKHLVFSLAVRRKIQCLLFLLRYGAYFQPVGFAYHAGFRCSVSEFGAMRLNLSAALVGGHSRSRSCVMLSIIITLEIVNWLGAVIVLGGRQSYEICSIVKPIHYTTGVFEKMALLFGKVYTLFMTVLPCA